MGWEKPDEDRAAQKRQLASACRVLKRGMASEGHDAWLEAAFAINQWRMAHQRPADIIKQRLQAHASIIDSRALVVSRIKSLATIKDKLFRLEDTGMDAFKMQDIGGCRAILDSVESAQSLASRVKGASEFKIKRDKPM